MAKFLTYEDRLEIQNGLKEHMTFTQIGEKLSRDRTAITKEVRNYYYNPSAPLITKRESRFTIDIVAKTSKIIK